MGYFWLIQCMGGGKQCNGELKRREVFYDRKVFFVKIKKLTKNIKNILTNEKMQCILILTINVKYNMKNIKEDAIWNVLSKRKSIALGKSGKSL